MGLKFRNGKIRLLVKIDRRAGSVTIASGNARLKRRPRAASQSMFGVCTCGDPYAPTWSGLRLSMISSRTFVGSVGALAGQVAAGGRERRGTGRAGGAGLDESAPAQAHGRGGVELI